MKEETTKNTVWMLFEDREFGYYGARCGISNIIGIYSTEEKALASNASHYCLIKEIELDVDIDFDNPYEVIK